MALSIHKTQTPQDLENIRELFCEYQDWLNVSCCFSGFQNELENLANVYTALYLAFWEGQLCGCVGIKTHHQPKTCEMKRLYVREGFRDKKIGYSLANKSIETAKQQGFGRIYLETVDHLEKALKLYADLGFSTCESPTEALNQGLVYLEKRL